jgi:hypothetical protein
VVKFGEVVERPPDLSKLKFVAKAKKRVGEAAPKAAGLSEQMKALRETVINSYRANKAQVRSCSRFAHTCRKKNPGKKICNEVDVFVQKVVATFSPTPQWQPRTTAAHLRACRQRKRKKIAGHPFCSCQTREGRSADPRRSAACTSTSLPLMLTMQPSKQKNFFASLDYRCEGGG